MKNLKGPHSVDQIQDTRLRWWRTSHLQSILSEEQIVTPKTALDVGVGGGHWAVSLFSAFPEGNIDISAIDIEQHWVEESTRYVSENLTAHRFSAQSGNVCQLEFESNSFDLVTCQTVLMHLDTPERALQEMCRVLRPGGVLMASEPMNQLNMSLASSLLAVDDPELGKTIWGFWQTYHTKLNQLGYGDHNIAARLPGLILDIDRMETISAYHSDVVSFQRPGEQPFGKLLNYLKTDPKSQEVLTAFENRRIDEFEGALKRLENKLVARRHIVSCPQQNILFVSRKK